MNIPLYLIISPYIYIYPNHFPILSHHIESFTIPYLPSGKPTQLWEINEHHHVIAG